MIARRKTPAQPRKGVAALEKGLDLLLRIARDKGAAPLSEHAHALGIAPSTARRLANALERRGFLTKAQRGCYAAGVMLADITTTPDVPTLLAEAGRPLLRRLARSAGCTAHMGLMESDMVTYIVKEEGGAASVFTKENMQLEAYCSAIGKLLLAHMSSRDRESYLSTAPFVALTPNTITNSNELRRALRKARRDGYATDDAEIAEDLYCVAVPIRDRDRCVVAAISCSQFAVSFSSAAKAALLEKLRACAGAIEARLPHGIA